MATNANFYERQKYLQDQLHERERERIQLEQHLNAYMKSDERLARLKAVKLQWYWKKLSENEEKSRERNERVLQQFEKMELQMKTLSERTEQLKQLKTYYEKELESKYPDWREKAECQPSSGPSLQDKMSHRVATPDNEFINKHNSTEPYSNGDFHNRDALSNHYVSPTTAAVEVPIHMLPVYQQQTSLLGKYDQKSLSANLLPSDTKSLKNNDINVIDDSRSPNVDFGSDVETRPDVIIDDKIAKRHHPQVSEPNISEKLGHINNDTNVEDFKFDLRDQEYDTKNLHVADHTESIYSEPKHIKYGNEMQGDALQNNRGDGIYVNAVQLKEMKGIEKISIPSMYEMDGEKYDTAHDVVTLHASKPSPISMNESNLHSNIGDNKKQKDLLNAQDKQQPVTSHNFYNSDSDEDRKNQNNMALFPNAQRELLANISSDEYNNTENTGTSDARSNNYEDNRTPVSSLPSMYNIGSDEDEDEDSDEPHEDAKIVDRTYSEDAIPTAIEVHVTKITHSDDADAMQQADNHLSLEPELSLEGLVRLLIRVQQDFANPYHTHNYYQSQLPTLVARNDIILKANTIDDLTSVDATIASMVILEQLTLVSRNLSSACLLDDSLINNTNLSYTDRVIRNLLPDDSRLLWDALINHFRSLISYNIMSSNEIAAVFIPGMVSQASSSQNQAFSLLVKVLDIDEQDSDSDTPPPLPTSPIPVLQKNRKPDDVPTLSLVSTADPSTTQRTEDNSEVADISLASDIGFKFNLSDTAAYRSMVSGKSSGPAISSNVVFDDSDDEDLAEKHLQSILPANYQTTGKSAIKHKAIKLDSDSDVDQPNQEASKKLQDDIDFDFYE